MCLRIENSKIVLEDQHGKLLALLIPMAGLSPRYYQNKLRQGPSQSLFISVSIMVSSDPKFPSGLSTIDLVDDWIYCVI